MSLITDQYRDFFNFLTVFLIPYCNCMRMQMSIYFIQPASTMRIHPGETIIDLSDNMRLTEEEKQYWLNFSRQVNLIPHLRICETFIFNFMN